MNTRIKTVFYVIGILALLVVNIQALQAHDWGSWHWDKSTLQIWVWGTHQAEAQAAIQDWDSHTDLSLPVVGSHTDISVFGGSWGATGWSGLAEIIDYEFDWWHRWCFCRIKHAHARYNSYYGFSTGTGTASGSRGIFCQEVGHTFGLDHSPTGDCMAKTYWSPSSNVTSPHNWADINAKY